VASSPHLEACAKGYEVLLPHRLHRHVAADGLREFQGKKLVNVAMDADLKLDATDEEKQERKEAAAGPQAALRAREVGARLA
jgi:HSP90 family molecular chaperone